MSEDKPKQIVDSAALKSMTPDQLSEAVKDGGLDAMMKGANIRKGKKLSPRQRVVVLNNLTAEEFEQAEKAGLIPPELLGEEEPPAPDATDQESDAPSGDIDQGARTASAKSPREALRRMNPEEIRAGLARGDFDHLLRGEELTP
jgi:hypothetical protein